MTSDRRPAIPDTGLRIQTEVKAQTRRRPRGPRARHRDQGRATSAYGDNHVLHDITMDIADRRVTAFIGPSGCGKSTLLRCLNRMNDLIDDVKITGSIRVKGLDINAATTDVIEVRRRVGMVFQKSNPFPKSIYENVVYGLRIAGINDKATLDEACERRLQGRGALGRGEGPAARERPGPLRRPAAAAVHRPGHRRGARDHPHGRALLGPRPHRHPEDRGADLHPEGEVHDHHRDPQPAAGGPGVRPHRLLLAGPAGGVRPHPATCSPSPREKQTEDYITGRFG